MSNILRIHAVSGERFELTASKSTSKSLAAGIVGRVKAAPMLIWRGLTDAVIREYIAETDGIKRAAILASVKPGEVASAVNLTGADYAGFLTFAGGLHASNRLINAGILVVPQATGTMSVLEAMLANAGLNPADFDDTPVVVAPETVESLTAEIARLGGEPESDERDLAIQTAQGKLDALASPPPAAESKSK